MDALSMVTHVLDTCVISDFVKGQPGVVSKLLSLPPNVIGVSTISIMEIEYGLALDQARAKKLRPKMKAFFDVVHLIPFSVDDAVSAAVIRSELKKIGTPIGPYDILLAGTALQRDLIFITSNTKEFQRIKELKIEDWGGS